MVGPVGLEGWEVIAGEATPVDMALGRRKNAKETKCKSDIKMINDRRKLTHPVL